MSDHVYYKCGPDCEKAHCQFCHGGLSFCVVCKCGEGDLPSECPGSPVKSDDRIRIYNDGLDFIGDKWVSK